MELKILFPGGSKIDAEYKGFLVKTDQPVYSGGDGTAPAPFDLFMISIGTCAGIYVQRFLEQRGFSIDEVEMVMRTEVNREKKMIGKILFDLTLPVSFPEKYKKALINSINLCAVKKHMFDPPVFETNIHIGEKLAANQPAHE